jgi:TPR repeat protein
MELAMRSRFLLLMMVAACGSGAQSVVTPAATAPVPATSSCSPARPAEPFIVDWAPDKRGDVELALKRSVIAAKVTCDGVELLRDCQVEGEYLYAGMTEREELLSLRDGEDLRSKLPPSGNQSPPRLKGEFERGATVDVALAVVGKKTSSTRRVLRSDLRGECNGATHFVRSAALGAFAMQVAGPSKAKSIDDIFGRENLGTVAAPMGAINRDGSLDACRKSQPDGDKPQGNCASPLRLELRPLMDGPVVSTEPANDSESGRHTCPIGLAPTDDGKCVNPASNLPRLCDYKEPNDCAAQCERGSMGSCAVLGRSYQIGRGVAQDPKKATDLLVRACKGGAPPACSRIGEILLTVPDKQQDGLQLLQKSCSAGWAEACTIAGAHLAKSRDAKVDVLGLLRRGCSAGDAEGCWTLGTLFEQGLGVPKNDAEAIRYHRLGCDGGARLGCSAYSKALEEGKGTSPDAVRAMVVLQNACDHGYSASCAELSSRYFLGKGVTRDVNRGIGLLERACEGSDPGSCVPLGMRYAQGVGVTADKTRASRYLTKACEAGLTMACEQALELGKAR